MRGLELRWISLERVVRVRTRLLRRKESALTARKPTMRMQKKRTTKGVEDSQAGSIIP